MGQLEKQCFKCLMLKPLSDFYTHSRMADGHLNKCKECTKTDVRSHRYGPAREQVLAYDRGRASAPHRVEQRKRIGKEWAQANPDRKRAHTILHRSIIKGETMRWPVCFMPECNGKPEAHHPDYSDPLAVVWLCPAHHRQAHALAKKLKDAA